MPDTKIKTLHPEKGKSNKPVPVQEYNIVKEAILKVLKKTAPTHTELEEQVAILLQKTFTGNISWYVMVVKLDLEARKIIVRTASKPEKYLIK